MQELTIMSYNVLIHGSGKHTAWRRAGGVVSVLRGHMPDSFGVQEADEKWQKYLKKNLPEYAAVGLGRNNDLTGEACLVFFRKDRYELVRSHTFWLSDTPEYPSTGWDGRFNRVATFAVLRDKKTGFTYAHLNTHFDHIGVAARENAVPLVAETIRQLQLPCVMTGDLNEHESSRMYQMIGENGLRDTKYLAETSDTGGTYHGYREPDFWENDTPIDFIFVNDFCQSVAEYRILKDRIKGEYPSDHFPVLARLTMNEANS